jgi:flagellar motor switch protein FliN
MTVTASAKEESTEVHMLKLAELPTLEPSGRRLIGENLELIRNLKVRLSVAVGQCELTVKELFELRENSVLSLDKDTRDPVEISLDGKVVARGFLVAIDDSFGVRISEITGA